MAGRCIFASVILRFALVGIVFVMNTRGEMCSVLTQATPGEDLKALRDKTFAAFRTECKKEDKKQDQPKVTSCSFVTQPHRPHIFTFVLGPLSVPLRVNFEVKTAQDALIALADGKTRGSIFADIAIGGEGNTWAAIRPCHADYCLGNTDVHEEAGIVSGEESRPFWIEFAGGVVRVGKGGQEGAFLEWDAGAYHGEVASQVYVGIASWGASVHGEWTFFEVCDKLAVSMSAE